MKNYFKNQYLQLLRNQGKKAGIVPFEKTENEVERLAEVKRLGILELELSGERRYNSMTQVATYLTGCKQSAINILGSNVQQCKANFCFNMMQSTMFMEIPTEISVCKFSLSNPGQPLIIENILEDERTKNMKNMTFDPGFRFYAGSAGNTFDILGMRLILPQGLKAAVKVVKFIYQKKLRNIWNVSEVLHQYGR